MLRSTPADGVSASGLPAAEPRAGARVIPGGFAIAMELLTNHPIMVRRNYYHRDALDIYIYKHGLMLHTFWCSGNACWRLSTIIDLGSAKVAQATQHAKEEQIAKLEASGFMGTQNEAHTNRKYSMDLYSIGLSRTNVVRVFHFFLLLWSLIKLSDFWRPFRKVWQRRTIKIAHEQGPISWRPTSILYACYKPEILKEGTSGIAAQ